MKLNMGCGLNRRDGYLNVDKFGECMPDMVVDLEVFPWPWQDNSVTEVLFVHSLEHMGQQVSCFMQIMKELWRVCADGAEVKIWVPHPRHDNFMNDPTHVRAITPELLMHFDLQLNEAWGRAGFSNTPLALYSATDFVLTQTQATPDPRWVNKLASGEITEQALSEASRDFNNVIVEYQMTLKVRKPSVV